VSGPTPTAQALVDSQRCAGHLRDRLGGVRGAAERAGVDHVHIGATQPLADLACLLASSLGEGHVAPTVEVYWPPYLFRGARPDLTLAGDQGSYGGTVTATTDKLVPRLRRRHQRRPVGGSVAATILTVARLILTYQPA